MTTVTVLYPYRPRPTRSSSRCQPGLAFYRDMLAMTQLPRPDLGRGITRRFDGYNYFGAHPEVAIDWFNSHSA